MNTIGEATRWGLTIFDFAASVPRVGRWFAYNAGRHNFRPP